MEKDHELGDDEDLWKSVVAHEQEGQDQWAIQV